MLSTTTITLVCLRNNWDNKSVPRTSLWRRLWRKTQNLKVTSPPSSAKKSAWIRNHPVGKKLNMRHGKNCRNRWKWISTQLKKLQSSWGNSSRWVRTKTLWMIWMKRCWTTCTRDCVCIKSACTRFWTRSSTSWTLRAAGAPCTALILLVGRWERLTTVWEYVVVGSKDVSSMRLTSRKRPKKNYMSARRRPVTRRTWPTLSSIGFRAMSNW